MIEVEGDPLGCARGIILAAPFALILWAIIIGVGLYLWTR